MKFIIPALLAFTSFLHAETPKEFADRVAAAWNSKSAAEFLALYGDPAKLDPGFIDSQKTYFEFKLKAGYSKVEVSLALTDHLDNKSFVVKERIMYPSTPFEGRVSVYFYKEAKETSPSKMMMPYVKGTDGKYALGSPSVKKFEWTGEEQSAFHVSLKSEKVAAFIPEVIVVVEKFGHVDWLTMNKNSSIAAHKILSLIISPTPDAETLSVEITKNANFEPVFKQTVNTAKGAVVPVTASAP